MKLKIFYLTLVTLFSFMWFARSQGADLPWTLKLTQETSVKTPHPFVFLVAADLNHNGINELVVNNFGWFHRERIYSDSYEEALQNFLPYNLFILEWDGKELALSEQRRLESYSFPLDGGRRQLQFSVGEVNSLLVWKMGSKTTIEGVPLYFGVEWSDGQYLLRRQLGTEEGTVGSWALPFLTASCYANLLSIRETWPKECLVGIRDFEGKGKPRIVSIVEERGKDENYNQRLRVRRYEPGFPIEWEEKPPKRLIMGMNTVDPLNSEATSGLFIGEYVPNVSVQDYFDKDPGKPSAYRLRPTNLRYNPGKDEPPFGLTETGRIGKTQQRDREEYWVYWVKASSDKYANRVLQRVTVKPDLSGVIKEDVEFEHHEPYLGVEHFIVGDLDGDGLDEVVLVEATGKRELDGESMAYSNTKDYVHVLKWDGKRYRTVWVSPPYPTRGTRLLIADIKNSGKKQLVVGTGEGRIQIWEKQ